MTYAIAVVLTNKAQYREFNGVNAATALNRCVRVVCLRVEGGIRWPAPLVRSPGGVKPYGGPGFRRPYLPTSTEFVPH
jgi:hypothetical protein